MEVLSSFSNIFVLLSVFLATQFYIAVSQEMFTIIRKPGDGGPWTDLDQFKLPDSKCSRDCSDWKAYTVQSQPCHCVCSYNQAATFGFYSGSWKCLANTEVRNQTGKLCKYKFRYRFQSEQDNYPLRILQEGAQENVVLPPFTGCSVDQATSRYFTCDGRWAGIESQSFGQWFSIQYKRLSFGGRAIYTVKIGSSISADLLGRIISLNITCPQEHSCLLFKLQGTFQCAENVTSVITSPSSAVPSPTIPATATATAATSASKTTANLNDNGKKEKAVKTSGSSSTVVGVVVTLVIIIVIVIVMVAYVYRKKQRGESIWLVDYISSRVRKTRSSRPTKKTATEEKQEDPEYAEIPEEQRRNEPYQAGGIYSYAFDDPQTAYIAPQPAPYNRLVHNRQEPDEEEAIYSTADDGPVYNVLERPPAEGHIAMVPESTLNEGNASQDLQPEYHVLEGPDTSDETTEPPLDGNTDVRASNGSANPSGPHTGHVAPKERRKPPSPPRKK